MSGGIISDLEHLCQRLDRSDALIVRRAIDEIRFDAKLLLPIVSPLNNIVEAIEEDGDRSYFGSTNDADSLKEIADTLDQWRLERDEA